MTCRRDYTADPSLRERVFTLLDVVFPGIAGAEAALRPWGLDWTAVSTPYVVEDGERVLAHVGLIPFTAELDGVRQPLGSVHAVATDPGHRRQGLFRRAFEELLADCEGRFKTLQLTTSNPEYYEPFGFRHVPEHRWVGPAPTAEAGPLRDLDLTDTGDRALMLALLDARAPVSTHLGVVAERAGFIFNWARKPIAYAADLDVAVAYQRADQTLRVIDVVWRGDAVPPLRTLLARLCAAAPCDRVELYLTPDHWALDLAPEPHLLDGDDYLMVRGPYPSGPLTLPRTLRT